MAVNYALVRQFALSLPGVEEAPWYVRPALKVDGKGFARLHEDGDSLVLRVSFVDRDLLLRRLPKVVYITDHYRNYPAMTVARTRHHRAHPLERCPRHPFLRDDTEAARVRTADVPQGAESGRGDLGVVAEDGVKGPHRHSRRRHKSGRVPARPRRLKVCAVDETWSGLKLVIRKENRRRGPAKP
jgi:hypothetical protein